MKVTRVPGALEAIPSVNGEEVLFLTNSHKIRSYHGATTIEYGRIESALGSPVVAGWIFDQKKGELYAYNISRIVRFSLNTGRVQNIMQTLNSAIDGVALNTNGTTYVAVSSNYDTVYELYALTPPDLSKMKLELKTSEMINGSLFVSEHGLRPN